MSKAVTIPNWVKSLSSPSSSVDLSMIVFDTAGNPMRLTPLAFNESLMRVESDYVSDFNEATEPGLYALHGSSVPKNGPEGISFIVGMLEVFFRDGSTGLLFQRAISSDGVMAVRTRYYGKWNPWHVLQ